MAIKVVCQGCGAKFNAPDGAAGKRGKCPKCGEAIVVPAATKPAPAKPPARSIDSARKPAGFDDPPSPPPPAIDPSPPPAPAPAPVVDQAIPTQPTPTVNVDHSVKAKGAFGSAFKGTLGCITAVVAVMFVGCVATGVFLVGGTAVMSGAIDEVERARAEVREQFEAEGQALIEDLEAGPPANAEPAAASNSFVQRDERPVSGADFVFRNMRCSPAFGGQMKVSGEIENRGSKSYQMVNLDVRFLDRSDEWIAGGGALIMNFEPGQKRTVSTFVESEAMPASIEIAFASGL